MPSGNNSERRKLSGPHRSRRINRSRRTSPEFSGTRKLDASSHWASARSVRCADAGTGPSAASPAAPGAPRAPQDEHAYEALHRIPPMPHGSVPPMCVLERAALQRQLGVLCAIDEAVRQVGKRVGSVALLVCGLAFANYILLPATVPYTSRQHHTRHPTHVAPLPLPLPLSWHPAPTPERPRRRGRGGAVRQHHVAQPAGADARAAAAGSVAARPGRQGAQRCGLRGGDRQVGGLGRGEGVLEARGGRGEGGTKYQ